MTGDNSSTDFDFSNPTNPAENRYEMPPGLVIWKVHFDVRVGPESLCGKKRHTKERPPDEFPKAFGYKSGARNDIFRFAS